MKSNQTEESLTRAFVRFRDRGDSGALAEVFDNSAPSLYRLGLHLLGDPHRRVEGGGAFLAKSVVAETKSTAADTERASTGDTSVDNTPSFTENGILESVPESLKGSAMNCRLPVAATSLIFHIFMSAGGTAGTLSVPGSHASIQEAIDAASSGDTIEIGEGTWFEKLNATSKSDLRIMALDGTKVVIDATEDGVPLWLSQCQSVQVEGLEFIHSTFSTGLLITDSSQVRVSDCTFRDLAGAGATAVDSSQIEITDCRFVKNGLYSVNFERIADGLIRGNRMKNASGFGVRVSGDRVAILDNRIDHGSIVLGDGTDGGSACVVSRNRIESPQSGGVRVRNGVSDCFISDNRITDGQFDGINLSGGADRHHILGNTVKNCGWTGIRSSSVVATIADNRIVDCFTGLELETTATSNLVSGNRVKNATEDAVVVQGTGNTLLGNLVKKSLSPLADFTGIGSNTYVGNSFKGPGG